MVGILIQMASVSARILLRVFVQGFGVGGWLKGHFRGGSMNLLCLLLIDRYCFL